MGIETTIDREKDLTIQKVTGEIHSEDIIAAIEGHYDRDFTNKVLWDFRDASYDAINLDQLESIAKETKRYSSLRSNGKTALVVESDLGFGLGRTFDSLMEFQVTEVAYMVFRDIDSAMKWLLDDPPQQEGA
jgi:hypothetical protein